MNKTIILLSGSPGAKAKFIESAKKIAWLWNLSPKDFIRANSKIFYWVSEPDNKEKDNRYLREMLELLNRHCEFERKYLEQNLQNFQDDDSQQKENKEGKVFDNFVAIIHGVSKPLVNFLQEDFGAFRIHVSRHDLNTNEELQDITLYEDDENFSERVLQVISTLAR
jgi:hypothetical protein